MAAAFNDETDGLLEELVDEIGGWLAICWALVSVFQSFTGVGWSDQMYKVQDAWGWPAFVYFMLLVVFGMWIMANLLIAVLEPP